MRDQDRTDALGAGETQGGSGFTMGVIGTLLLLGGLLYFLHVMGWVSFTGVQPWELWPLVLVIIGFRASSQTRGTARAIAALMALVGVALLALNLGFLDAPWQRLQDWMLRHELDPRLLWAGLLVLAGLFFLSGGRLVTRRTRLPGDRVRQLAVFGGFELKPDGTDFQGGWLAAVFGGFEVDLRRCSTTAEVIHLTVVGVFGGGEIKVPTHWKVTIGGLPIFGGYSNETTYEPQEGQPTTHLVINGIAVFGGFGVEN